MEISIKKKIAGIASQTEIAKRMGRTPQTVSLWLKGEVPAKSIRDFCAALGWQVTPHEINPHIYPNANDGMQINAKSNGAGL
ncbi:transcriptional regulator [Rahnella aceris]|uniref:transcriptional regulator n=1 Tax=Rahnella sp. (strain Y9602) TaxID=2703885 RepID=UPI001C2579D5|nr:YdaS family helix-turn-helix protein [Rahnella aceris]MBU9866785.1 helix-turn-helix domain-containing protein [Rahnella aceris]